MSYYLTDILGTAKDPITEVFGYKQEDKEYWRYYKRITVGLKNGCIKGKKNGKLWEVEDLKELEDYVRTLGKTTRKLIVKEVIDKNHLKKLIEDLSECGAPESVIIKMILKELE